LQSSTKKGRIQIGCGLRIEIARTQTAPHPNLGMAFFPSDPPSYDFGVMNAERDYFLDSSPANLHHRKASRIDAGDYFVTHLRKS